VILKTLVHTKRFLE